MVKRPICLSQAVFLASTEQVIRESPKSQTFPYVVHYFWALVKSSALHREKGTIWDADLNVRWPQGGFMFTFMHLLATPGNAFHV